MIEKTIKFFFRNLLLIFTLFGVRYVLSIVGIVIPLEWFVVMISGTMGFYGIIIIVLCAIFINFI